MGKEKVAYKEDELFAAISKNGDWYLSHTTLDPDNKFKSEYVGSFPDGPPPDDVIKRTEINAGKAKHYLRKNNQEFNDWLETTYNFTFSPEESPFKPKPFRLGSKAVKRPREEEGGEVAAFKKPTEQDTGELKRMEKKLDDLFLLCTAVHREVTGKKPPPPTRQEEREESGSDQETEPPQ